jgi:hypothetical protein
MTQVSSKFNMASLIVATGEDAGVSSKLDRYPLLGGREANRDIHPMDATVVQERVTGRRSL